MNKEFRNLILLFLFSFVIRISFLAFVQIKYWDETVYLSLAKDLASNFFNYSLQGAFWSDYIPFGHGLYSWPNIGFRAPLLPVTLSLFYRLGLDFLINFFIPFIGAAGTVVIYFLGKKVFNQRVGWYSAILFSIIPINLIWGFRISTEIYGIFFLLVSLLFFWKGFEEEHNPSKILFGIFLAISILTRYTMMWILPIFLFYFLFRDRSLEILRDRYLWFSVLSFFIVLIPWLIYGIKFYHHPLGSFIHGTVGASFWGGVQSLFFYFGEFWTIFSVAGILLLFSLVYIFWKKSYYDKRIFFLLVFFLFFFIVASLVPHKEERFILPVVIPVSLLVGFFISKMEVRLKFSKTKNFWIKFCSFILLFLIAFVPVFTKLNSEENRGTQICFAKGLEYLKTLNAGSLIYTDEPPIVYAYTNKKTRYYPNPWNLSRLEKGEENYILYTDYDRPLFIEENVLFRGELQQNLERIFYCDEDWGITEVYRIGN